MTIAMVGGAAALLCFAAVDAFAEKTENGFSFWFNLVSWPQSCDYSLLPSIKDGGDWLPSLVWRIYPILRLNSNEKLVQSYSCLRFPNKVFSRIDACCVKESVQLSKVSPW